MRKGSANHFHRHGRYAGWRDHRYGTEPAPVTLAGQKPIHGAGVRKQLVQQVADVMRDWKLSPFEHEGPCCQGLRSALCLKGQPWKAADVEATLIVAGAIHQLGLTRPTTEQGQPDWTDGFDYCSTCRGALDDGARYRKQRFCSPECARIAVNNRELRFSGPLEATRRAAARIIAHEATPPKTCIHCETPFRSSDPEAQHCSHACASQWRRTGLLWNDIECLGCGKTAKPVRLGSKYCSYACRTASTIVRESETRYCLECTDAFAPQTDRSKFCSSRCQSRHIAREKRKRAGQGLYHRECECCGVHFIGKVPSAKACSAACAETVNRWRRGEAKRITPRVFDYMLRQEGARITDVRCEAA